MGFFLEQKCNKKTGEYESLQVLERTQATVFSMINVLFNNFPGHPNCGVGSCFSALNWKTLASVLLPFLLLSHFFSLLEFLLFPHSHHTNIPTTSFFYRLAYEKWSQLCHRFGKNNNISFSNWNPKHYAVELNQASAVWSKVVVRCQVYSLKKKDACISMCGCMSNVNWRHTPLKLHSNSLFCEQNHCEQ